MTEAVSILPGPVVPEGLAPDIAGRIAMALELVERLRCSLAEKLAAFAGVPAALRVGLGAIARPRRRGTDRTDVLPDGRRRARGRAAARPADPTQGRPAPGPGC